MITFQDIYFKIDSKIVEKGFWDLDTEGKQVLLDEELKNYILLKLSELNTNLITDANKTLDISELLQILTENIPKDEHYNSISHFIHYILNVAQSLQGWSITWWIEDDDNLIEMPKIDFNINGVWDTLITHKNTDYVKTFNFVYNVFKTQILSKHNNKKLNLKLL